VASSAASAEWHSHGDPAAAAKLLIDARPKIRAEDLLDLDLSIAGHQWTAGNGAAALAASDSALARQSDHPEGLWNRAGGLALLGRFDDSFKTYESAVRLRTGVVSLRCDFARDLILSGALDRARAHLDEARLLDPENPNVEALRGWLMLAAGKPDSARIHAKQALAWGEWCDLARLVLGAAERKLGNTQAAEAAWQPVRERIARKAPPEFVYRKSLSTWERVHELPAVERKLLDTSGSDSKPRAN
jgi:tetratricopeptide (TPR) repeat protein